MSLFPPDYTSSGVIVADDTTLPLLDCQEFSTFTVFVYCDADFHADVNFSPDFGINFDHTDASGLQTAGTTYTATFPIRARYLNLNIRENVAVGSKTWRISSHLNFKDSGLSVLNQLGTGESLYYPPSSGIVSLIGGTAITLTTNAADTEITIDAATTASSVFQETAAVVTNITNSTSGKLLGDMTTNVFSGSNFRAGLLAGRLNTINGGNNSVVMAGSTNSLITSIDSAIICGSSHTTTSSDDSISLGGTTHVITGGDRNCCLGGRDGSILDTSGACFNSGTICCYTAGLDNCDQSVNIGCSTCTQVTTFDSLIASGNGNSLTSCVDCMILGSEGCSMTLVATTNDRCSIISSHNSTISDGQASVILAGEALTISSTGGSNAIIAGNTNSITGDSDESVVCAGTSNNIDLADKSFIGGGTSNAINGTNGLQHSRNGIIGGQSNTITVSEHCGIFGGENNSIISAAVTGRYSTIIGGRDNAINSSNDGSTIIGGHDNIINTADKDNVFVTGCHVTADAEGICVLADSSTVQMTVSTAKKMYARFVNGYDFYTNTAKSAGVQVGVGGGSWSSISDINKKENLIECDCDAMLAKVKNLKIWQFNYIGNPSEQKCFSPTAQDWHAAFPLDIVEYTEEEHNDAGEVTSSITKTRDAKDKLTIETQDQIGVLFNCVKALLARIEVLESR
jgi:hypothetical protein